MKGGKKKKKRPPPLVMPPHLTMDFAQGRHRAARSGADATCWRIECMRQYGVSSTEFFVHSEY